MQNFSLHTHTIEFDAKSTPAEMIAAARTKQMTAIGISNHFIVHPLIPHSNMYRRACDGGYDAMFSNDFDAAHRRFETHFQELQKLSDINPDIRILRGIEVDFFQYPGWRDGFEQVIKKIQPDYIISSTHSIEYKRDLIHIYDIPAAAREHCIDMYWRNVKLAAQSGLFNVIAHIDLLKKVNLGIEQKWARAEQEAIDAIADAGCVLEINTASFDKIGEPYPRTRVLEMAIKRNIPLILSDDAHRAEHVGRDFDGVESWARNIGAKNFVGYQKILDFSKQRH